MRVDEGLHTGDLDGLVLPLISVDEYVSKVSDDAVVFGFYIKDRNAARDLNRFLQKSPVALIDTDVSPAPDQLGYYLVFVELIENDRLGANLAEILREVEPLIGVELEQWRLHVRGCKDLQRFQPDRLTKLLKRERAPAKPSKARLEHAALRLLSASDLHEASVDNGVLRIARRGIERQFRLRGIRSADRLVETHAADFHTVAEESRLRRLLGEQWLIGTVGSDFLLTNINSGVTLAIQP